MKRSGPIQRRTPPRRSGIARKKAAGRIRTSRPLGTVRREAKAAGDLTEDQWQQVVEFYEAGTRGYFVYFVCAYCLNWWRPDQCVQEHVIPISKGGRHTAANVCVACTACNTRKGTQTWKPKLMHPLTEAR